MMRVPWQKSNANQLDLLGDAPAPHVAHESPARPKIKPAASAPLSRPLMLPVAQIDEDPANPRAEFPDEELSELADDIRQRGILVPLVVHPADAAGRHRLHFGARRLRAAVRAGLQEVPVVVRAAPADRYAQAAENLKRSNLSPLDLARFIRDQVAAGDSHAEVARRLGMNLTTVSHHLSLLELPPLLDEAMKSGRCTSPRTLHELSRLHEQQPERVASLVKGERAVTREAVASLRADSAVSPASRVIAQANAACARLEKLLGRIASPAGEDTSADLAALHARVAALAHRWPARSDRQTPGAARP